MFCRLSPKTGYKLDPRVKASGYANPESKRPMESGKDHACFLSASLLYKSCKYFFPLLSVTVGRSGGNKEGPFFLSSRNDTKVSELTKKKLNGLGNMAFKI